MLLPQFLTYCTDRNNKERAKDSQVKRYHGGSPLIPNKVIIRLPESWIHDHSTNLIKCYLIANDFSIETCRDIPMNTRAPVSTFLLCNLLKCVVPNSKQHVGSPLLLIETACFEYGEFQLECEEARNVV